MPWGTVVCLSERVLEKSYRTCTLVSDLGEGSRKWGFILGRVLSGEQG